MRSKNLTRNRVFIDSNVWIYSAINQDIAKQQIADSKIRALSESKSIVVSTQILNEVFVVCTKKYHADPVSTRFVLQNLRKHKIVIIDPTIIDRAIDIHILEQISYWDALMLAAAISANCTTLLTEDLTHGQVIQGIRIENPFL